MVRSVVKPTMANGSKGKKRRTSQHRNEIREKEKDKTRKDKIRNEIFRKNLKIPHS